MFIVVTTVEKEGVAPMKSQPMSRKLADDWLEHLNETPIPGITHRIDPYVPEDQAGSDE